MREYRSLHLQKNLGDVLANVADAPVVLLNRGQPRAVVMTAEEFRRLKRAAGETVPRAALPRVRKVIHVGARAADPLGYDTSDFWACARTMAEAALSGRNGDAVEDGIRRLNALLPETT